MPLIPAQHNYGCNIDIYLPSNCTEIDFNTLGYVEFSWTTGGTFCEGPHHVIIGGNPPSSWQPPLNNGVDWSLSSGTYSTWWMDRNIGGYVRVTRQDLANITTDNGQYHWLVTSYNYNSSSASGTFTIR